MMDEAKLIEKLKLIEALYAGAKTAGEKDAADRAKQQILERLKSIEEADPPIEFKFTPHDMWQQKVMIAILRRYGLKSYRYRRLYSRAQNNRTERLDVIPDVGGVCPGAADKHPLDADRLRKTMAAAVQRSLDTSRFHRLVSASFPFPLLTPE